MLRAGDLLAAYLTEANEALRESFGTATLPENARRYVRFIEERSKVPLYLLSVGARQSRSCAGSAYI